MKFKLSSWEKGELFMKDVASSLDLKIETRDAKQVILIPGGKVTFFPDDRGFALITAKNVDSHIKEMVEQLQKKYSQEE